ncbi:MAG: methyltransferase, TIGR04325 family [Oligoflexia bacterium]|nr:methyltransferase, TIGR04325 family [Oligoflexia bacterium]
MQMHKPQFAGPFSTWCEAASGSQGYDSDEIISKALAATLKVKEGRAQFERDTVLFEKPIFSTPITIGLVKILAKNERNFSIVDFGGSFGSTYFLYKNLLEQQNFLWLVIEQEKIVKLGNQHIKDDKLSFVDAYREEKMIDFLLFSSSIQYIENYKEVLFSLLNKKPKVIILDRTPFYTSSEATSIFIQHVPKEIYQASYPTWIFAKNEFQELLSDYRVVYSEKNPDQLDSRFAYMGYVFERKN